MVEIIREARSRGEGQAVTIIEQIDSLSMMNPATIRSADVWYAQVDNDCAGVAVVAPSQGDLGIRLKRIGILPEYQGQGIGSALVERLYDHYGPLEAHARIGSGANGFYRATGWEEVETDVQLNKYVYR